MHFKTIPLSQLETNLEEALHDCVESGEPIVVELPDHRLLAIHPLDSVEDDSLIEDLLATNPMFQDLVAKSQRSSRKPFLASQ